MSRYKYRTKFQFSGFVQDGSYEKKDSTLDPKKAWRIHSKTKRDKAKRQYLNNKCFGDGVPTWMKRHDNKQHRAWVRDNLSKENYDRLSTNKQVRVFLNPWSWY